MNRQRLKTHLAGWREWELNPVVIKELRQAVRSWSVPGMLLLLLIVLLVASLVVLVNQSLDPNQSDQLGGELFQTFLVILSIAGILFIPLYLGVRVAAERQDNNPDLLYISTLTPGRIIRGKFFCGAYVTLLFFSACLPFMALTNLLRGVDLPTVVFLLGMLFLVICAANLAAIFIACLPITKLFKVVVSLGGFIFLIYLVIGVLAMAVGMMGSGVGSMLFTHDFWTYCVTVLLLALGAGGLFYVLAVELISPPSTNRALVPRIYFTLFWLAGGVLAGVWAWETHQPALVLTWTYFASVLLVAALLVTMSNQDQLSLRVRRTISTNPLLRVLAFGFFNGAAGGLLWVAALVALTFGGTEAFFNLRPGKMVTGYGAFSGVGEYFEGFYPAMMLYLFAYGLFARFLHRRFMRRLAPKLVGILTVFITALTALATNIVLFFMNQLNWQTAEHLQLGNAFNLMSEHGAKEQMEHLYFALGLLLIGLLLNFRWFLAQWKNFRPPSPD